MSQAGSSFGQLLLQAMGARSGLWPQSLIICCGTYSLSSNHLRHHVLQPLQAKHTVLVRAGVCVPVFLLNLVQ